jgi:hypothetical protein
VSLDEIISELRSQSRSRLPPDFRDRVAALVVQPQNPHLFRQSRRADGTLTFQNVAVNPVFGGFPAPIFPDPLSRPFEEPIPATVAELKDEVKLLQARKSELIREEQHLLLCQQLLQNPMRIQSETERLSTVLLNMREVQCIVDYKVREILAFMRLHGPEPD